MNSSITTYTKTKELLKSEEIRNRFQEILGAKSQPFLASILSTVYQDDKLAQCDPNSVVVAAMQAAVLDLAVDKNLGQAYIIAYGGKDGYRAQFQIGYHGLIQLAHRTDKYVTINVAEIYEGERVREDRLTGTVKLNGKRTSDKIVAYCGYFKMKNGFEKYHYMTVEELNRHGQRYSKNYKFDNSLWKTDPDVMYRKTVLKQMLSKYGQLDISTKLYRVIEDEEEEDTVTVEARDITQYKEPEPPKEKKTRAKKEKEPVGDEHPPEEPVEDIEMQLAEEDLAEEPEPVKEPLTVEEKVDGTIGKVLVANGLFQTETMARTALLYYEGEWTATKINAWAQRTAKFVSEGMTLIQAAQKAN